MKFLSLGKHFSLFLIVGTLTACIYFSLFTIAWKILHIDYKVSVSIAYLFSVVFQFLANRQLTFNSQNENIISQVFKFTVLLIINYCITLFIVIFLVNTLLFSPYLAIISSLAVTVVTGFLLSKLWVFKISHA